MNKNNLNKKSMDNHFLQDFIKAIKHKDQWVLLAWYDIKSKYRRTVLGPIWILIVNLITIGCFAMVGAALFGQSLRNFLPHVAIGMFVWYYISGILNESCNIFTGNAYLIKNLNVNYLSLVLRLFIRNTIYFAHSIVLIVIIVALFVQNIGGTIFLTFFAIPCFALSSIGLCLIIGISTARYRDIGNLITSSMTIVPFVTPLMWKKEMLGDRTYIADLNPITHFISIIREPLINNNFPIGSYIICCLVSLAIFLTGMIVYNKYMKRTIFWI